MLAGLLFRIPFGGGGILLADILLPLYAGLYLTKKIFVDRSLPTFLVWGSGLTFLSIALFSWILGAWELDIKAKILSFAYLVRFFSILVLAASVKDILAKTNNNLDRFFNNLFIILALVVFLGFMQFYLLADISMFSTAGGFDPHMGRLLGTWMDPNFVAGLLAFFIPIIIGKIYSSEDTKEKSWLTLLCIVCLYAGLLTFSRSGYLAIAAGLFFYFLFRDPKIILIGGFIAMMGISSNDRARQRVTALSGTFQAVLFRDTDEVDVTAKLRVQSWQKTFELWKKYPVFGVGYNTYRYRAAEEGLVDESNFSSGGSDSTLLTVLVTTGVIGFLSFLFFYFQIWFWSWGQWRRQKEYRELFLGFTAGWTAILVHSVFVNSFLFPLIFMPIMVILGALYSFSTTPMTHLPDDITKRATDRA